MTTTLKKLPPEDQAFVKRDIVQLRAEGFSWRRIKDHLHVGYGVSMSHEAMRRLALEQ